MYTSILIIDLSLCIDPSITPSTGVWLEKRWCRGVYLCWESWGSWWWFNGSDKDPPGAQHCHLAQVLWASPATFCICRLFMVLTWERRGLEVVIELVITGCRWFVHQWTQYTQVWGSVACVGLNVISSWYRRDTSVPHHNAHSRAIGLGRVCTIQFILPFNKEKRNKISFLVCFIWLIDSSVVCLRHLFEQRES